MVLTDKTLDKIKSRLSLPSPDECQGIRKAVGLSQSDVAAEVGVSTETISRWESGRTLPQHRHRATYLAVLDDLRRLGAEA